MAWCRRWGQTVVLVTVCDHLMFGFAFAAAVVADVAAVPSTTDLDNCNDIKFKNSTFAIIYKYSTLKTNYTVTPLLTSSK